MRLDPGTIAILTSQGLLIAAALSLRYVQVATLAAVLLNLVGLLLLRTKKSAPAAAVSVPGPVGAAPIVGAGGSQPAHVAGAATQPASGGDLVDETVIGIETGSHRFVPDNRAQSMPGFAAIYQQIAAGEMLGFVMVVAGPDRGRGVPIQQARITIGRNAGLSLVIHDTNVSAHQCEIWAEAGQVWLGDAGSKNGTWLNNKPVTQKKSLASCDVIAFGATKMLVTLGA